VKAGPFELIESPNMTGDGVWLCGYGYWKVESDKVQIKARPQTTHFSPVSIGNASPVELGKRILPLCGSIAGFKSFQPLNASLRSNRLRISAELPASVMPDV
jgi:hypothetical protein